MISENPLSHLSTQCCGLPPQEYCALPPHNSACYRPPNAVDCRLKNTVYCHHPSLRAVDLQMLWTAAPNNSACCRPPNAVDCRSKNTVYCHHPILRAVELQMLWTAAPRILCTAATQFCVLPASTCCGLPPHVMPTLQNPLPQAGNNNERCERKAMVQS